MRPLGGWLVARRKITTVALMRVSQVLNLAGLALLAWPGRPLPVALVGGIAELGAQRADLLNVTIVGGETAEHPGLMEAGTFDLAGTCLGIVERDSLLDGTAARAGDAIFGLPSSGPHANGYALVRSLVAQWDIPLQRPYQEQLARTLGEAGRDAAFAAEGSATLATVGDVRMIRAGGVQARVPQPAGRGRRVRRAHHRGPRRDRRAPGPVPGASAARPPDHPGGHREPGAG